MPYRPQNTTAPPISTPARKYGWKRKERSFSRHIFAISKTQAAITKVDLRPWCPPVYDQGDLGSCHDDQTEILTENGWKLFENLSETEKLATINPTTSELFYEEPIRLIKFHYSGDMIVGKHQFLDFKVTPDHMMLVKKWNQSERTLNEKYEFINAKDIGWYCGLMNRIKWNGNEKASDVYIIPKVEHKNRNEQRSDKIIPMNIWLRFLGIYLAEGCFCFDEGHYKIQIAAYKEREKQFIQEVFNNMELNYLELKDRFTFDNKQIYEELSRLGLKGVHAPQKFVPEFVFDQSSENIKEFLLGHFSGDGCENKNNKCRSHYTSSERLADDLQRLIFLSGDQSGLYKRGPRRSIMKDGRIVQGRYPECRVSVCENRTFSIERKKNITTESYDGFVYCAEVPTYHTLVTRRNYRVLISGNCTANTIAAAYEFDEIKQKEKCDFQPSRLFIYYGERTIENSVFEDAGADVSDGVTFINTTGVCPETIPANNSVQITSTECWPYDVSKFMIRPPDLCYEFAKNHKSVNSRGVTQSLEQLKQALINGFPVTMGFEVYPSFESTAVTNTGLVPMPSVLDKLRGSLGGHCVLIVGFDDAMVVHGNTGAFIVRNSWGIIWGDKGYFYIPYKYVIDPTLASDFWTITTVSDIY